MENFDKIVEACVGKLNKEEPFSTMGWGEIVDYLGIDYHPDNLRKGAYFLKKYHDYLQDEKMQSMSSDEIEKLNEKILELKKERVKFNDLRTEINRQVRSQARYEDLLETVKHTVDKCAINNPFENFKVNISNVDEDVREGIILLSDLHYGQVTKTFLNDYNSNEFNKRLKYLTKRVIDISKLHNVQKINIIGLGDYTNGLIHVTTRMSNRESIVEQVLQVSEKLSNMIYELSKEIPYVTLSMTDDNHGRIFANKNENTDKDSFVPFIKEFIKMRTSNIPNFVFIENTIDSGIVYLNVCDRNIIGVHGDKDRLNTAIPRMVSLLKMNIDYMCVAHYHNIKEDTYGEAELIVNGSFGGSDEYSKNLRLHSMPMQKYMIFSRKYGRECTYNINLKEVI